MVEEMNEDEEDEDKKLKYGVLIDDGDEVREEWATIFKLINY